MMKERYLLSIVNLVLLTYVIYSITQVVPQLFPMGIALRSGNQTIPTTYQVNVLNFNPIVQNTLTNILYVVIIAIIANAGIFFLAWYEDKGREIREYAKATLKEGLQIVGDQERRTNASKTYKLTPEQLDAYGKDIAMRTYQKYVGVPQSPQPQAPAPYPPYQPPMAQPETKPEKKLSDINLAEVVGGAVGQAVTKSLQGIDLENTVREINKGMINSGELQPEWDGTKVVFKLREKVAQPQPSVTQETARVVPSTPVSQAPQTAPKIELHVPTVEEVNDLVAQSKEAVDLSSQTLDDAEDYKPYKVSDEDRDKTGAGIGFKNIRLGRRKKEEEDPSGRE